MFQNIIKFTYKSLLVCCFCAMSFETRAAETQCLYNDCENLGYKSIDTLGDTPCESFLACPYDSRYIKCDLLPTCEELGFSKDEKLWCSNIVRCPTDPSYTLCRSLCGECRIGVLDPSDLDCADGYEPAILKPKGGKPRIAENDCGYTCYKCKDCSDAAYWCDEDGGYCTKDEDENETCECYGESTVTSCENGEYISEVRHPTCSNNSDLPDRYICEPCPEGWTNEGENSYACDKCDNTKGYYDTCQQGWTDSECTEVHSEFGTCYSKSLVCGQGTLSDYKYNEELSLLGHNWFSQTDVNGDVCWKTTCNNPLAAIDINMAFQTQAGCEKAYGWGSSICKKDGYDCYIFDKCMNHRTLGSKNISPADLIGQSGFDRYPLNPSIATHTPHITPIFQPDLPSFDITAFTCMCDRSYYKYTEAELEGKHVIFPYCTTTQTGSYPTTTCSIGTACEDDLGTYYTDFSCELGYVKGNDGCVCDKKLYSYTQIPANSLPMGTCTDDNGKHYSGFNCQSPWIKSGENCVCPAEYSYTDSNLPAYAKLSGDTCTQNGVTYYTGFTCNTNYVQSGQSCVCESKYHYNKNNIPYNSHLAGSSCTDGIGTHYTGYLCNSGYHNEGGVCVKDEEYYSSSEGSGGGSSTGSVRVSFSGCTGMHTVYVSGGGYQTCTSNSNTGYTIVDTQTNHSVSESALIIGREYRIDASLSCFCAACGSTTMYPTIQMNCSGASCRSGGYFTINNSTGGNASVSISCRW